MVGSFKRKYNIIFDFIVYLFLFQTKMALSNRFAKHRESQFTSLRTDRDSHRFFSSQFSSSQQGSSQHDSSQRGSPNIRGAFSPPSTRSGTSYSAYSANVGQKRNFPPNSRNQSASKQFKSNQNPHMKSFAQVASFTPKIRQGGGDIDSRTNIRQSGRTGGGGNPAAVKEAESLKDLAAKINKVYKRVADDYEGIDTLVLRLEDVETDLTQPTIGLKDTLKSLKDDVAALKANDLSIQIDGKAGDLISNKLSALEKTHDLQNHRIEVMIGIIDRQQHQIDSLKISNASNMANSLADNVIVGGIRETPNEDCRDSAANFFAYHMGLNPKQEDIIYAQCMGERITKGDKTFPPLMKVRCSSYFRSLVWNNRQVLKGRTDEIHHWKFFVDIQRPEVFRAASTRYKAALDKVAEDNVGKDLKDHTIAKIQGTKLFVDREIVADPIVVPSPKDLLTNSSYDLELLDEIRCEQSNSYTLSDSTFKAFAIEIQNFGQANVAYKKIKLENLFASHIMMACSIKDGPDIATFSCDDGEDLAGAELEKLIKEHSFYNYALFVARWKLGGNMGSRHFKCINSVATQVIKKVKTKTELRPASNPSDKVINKDALNETISKKPECPPPATKDHDFKQCPQSLHDSDDPELDQTDEYGEEDEENRKRNDTDKVLSEGEQTPVSS